MQPVRMDKMFRETVPVMTDSNVEQPYMLKQKQKKYIIMKIDKNKTTGPRQQCKAVLYALVL